MANKEIELFCETTGFTFHNQGRGRWGVNPYYTFEKAKDDAASSFSIVYTPCTEEVRIESSMGSFAGRPSSLDCLRQLVEAMGIDFSLIHNEEEAKKNAQFKMERKMELAKRIAAQIQIKSGLNAEKCLSMAMQGDWWNNTTLISEMSNRNVDAFTRQILA